VTVADRQTEQQAWQAYTEERDRRVAEQTRHAQQAVVQEVQIQQQRNREKDGQR
jgi:hypothetical protein